MITRGPFAITPPYIDAVRLVNYTSHDNVARKKWNKEDMITPEHWNHQQYQLGKDKALIGLVADQEGITWAITVLDENNRELHHHIFPKLEEACEVINARYHEWNFVDLAETSNKSGCSSCSAKEAEF